jgi:putative hydrolase of the HAD superfamily
VKAIVFDFGNVVGLFDNRIASRRWAEHCDLSVEAIHALLFGTPLEDEYESGRITTAEFLRRLHDLCGLRCSEETAATAYADIFWPNRNVCALLPRLKPRYRLLLGSNTNDLHARQFRRQLAEPLSYFDALVLSYEIGTRKPNADFFAHCQRLAGCEAGECLFIDDLPVNVAGARTCGWQGIVYRDYSDLLHNLRGLGILPASGE